MMSGSLCTFPFRSVVFLLFASLCVALRLFASLCVSLHIFDAFNGLFSFLTLFQLFTIMEESGLVFPTAADHVLSVLDRNNMDRRSFVRFEVPHTFRVNANLSDRC